MDGPSLYDSADLVDASTPDLEDSSTSEQRPVPGTALTASVETIDNDRAGGLNFSAGIVR